MPNSFKIETLNHTSTLMILKNIVSSNKKCINNIFFLTYRATVTEEEIREAFTKDEFEVKAFKFFP